MTTPSPSAEGGVMTTTRELVESAHSAIRALEYRLAETERDAGRYRALKLKFARSSVIDEADHTYTSRISMAAKVSQALIAFDKAADALRSTTTATGARG